MATKIYGVRITLDDYRAPVTALASIGLRQRTTTTTEAVSVGETAIDVTSAALLRAGDAVLLSGGGNSEVLTIKSIASNTITLWSGPVNSYSSGADVKAGSEMLIAENPVTGATEWAGHALAENGLGDWYIGFDSMLGGAVAKYGNTSVALVNTAKIQDELDDRGVTLSGLKAELVEITGTTVAVLMTGIIESPEWDAKIYRFTIKGDSGKRNAVIAKEVNTTDYPYASGDAIGQRLPVTIGEIRKNEVDGQSVFTYAKAVQIALNDEPWSASDNLQDIIPQKVTTFIPNDINSATSITFVPYISATPSTSTEQLDAMCAALIGKYIHIIYHSDSGTKGRYRKITNASFSGTVTNRPDLRIYYDAEFNATLTADDTTIFEITNGIGQFELDNATLLSASTSDGVYAGTTPETYFYTDKFDRIADGCFTTKTVGINGFVLDANNTSENLDSVSSVIAVPFPNMSYYSEDSITLNTVSDNNAVFSKLGRGLYGFKSHTTLPGYYDIYGITDFAFDGTARDRDGSTADNQIYSYQPTDGITSEYESISLVVKIDNIQDIKPNSAFDSLYVGLFTNTALALISGTDSGTNYIRYTIKGVLVDGSVITLNAGSNKGEDYTFTHLFSNLPEWYFTSNATSKTLYYKDIDTTTQSSGLTIAKLTINSQDIDDRYFAMLDKIIIAITIDYETDNSARIYTTTTNIYEAGLMFKISQSVNNAIYSPWYGRRFASTWDGRKDAAAMLYLPHDVLEMACRLQNYSDLQPEPSAGWGKAYAEAALIKTSGTGDFDAGTESSGFKCAFQLFDDNATTEYLKRLICKEYNQLSWVNSAGYECVRDMSVYSTSPAETITWGDIPDKASIRVTPPDVSAIYCQPIVRFNKNYATGEYQSKIEVTHVDAATWSASYVNGLSGVFAEAVWTRCKELYGRCRMINPMPDDLANLETMNGPGAWYGATIYLWQLMSIMGLSVIEFVLPNDLVAAWDVGHRFNVNLPHQTAGVAVECMVKSLRRKTSAPYQCTVEAYMITAADVQVDPRWQDTYATGTEYQDTYATGTEYQDGF